MKAIVCRGYGAEGLRLEDVDPPTPGDLEVLIRVRAAGLNALDWHLMKGKPPIARLFLACAGPASLVRGATLPDALSRWVAA